MTLNKSLNLSESQLPHLLKGTDNSTYSQGLDEFVYVMCIAQYLAQSKH